MTATRPDKKDFEFMITIMGKDANSDIKVGITPNKLFLLSNNNRNKLTLEFNYEEKELIIKDLVVYKKRKGRGTIILRELKKYAKQKGYHKVVVFHVQYPDIQQFLEKQGFEDAYTDDYRYEYLIKENQLEEVS